MAEWNDELLCGVEEIDRQHRQLFLLFESVTNKIDAGKDNEAIEEAFIFLEDYVKGHFAMEEHYMKHFNYTGYDEHKFEHEQFYEDFLFMKEKYTNMTPHPSVASELQGALYFWLATHVNRFDKDMCKFLKERAPVK